MMRVEVKPELLRWARERAGRDAEELRKRFPKYDLWECGDAKPTLKQLEALAKALYVPVGYLLLSAPPEEPVPIPDLRTIGSGPLRRPSPDLLDVLYLCQRRQAWYREYARITSEQPRQFVGSVNQGEPVPEAAEGMRRALGFDLEARRAYGTWTDALRQFVRQAEAVGVLVMVSGVVGSNNRRKLDPQEFRGFAISDDFAPLVFINGADTKAAQMFTLAHELAHLWLGESALTDLRPDSAPPRGIERWCNEVAAELLVPMSVLRDILPQGNPLADTGTLARRFKVSTLVILRRIYDAGATTRPAFRAAYSQELERLLAIRRPSGGDFYLTQEARSSRRFVQALVINTLEGQTLFRDAFQLLGIKKEKTFQQFAVRMGVPV